MSKAKFDFVIVGNGKYEFRAYEADWRIHVLRYNEPWLAIEQGSNAVRAMMFAVDEARKKMLQFEEENERLKCENESLHEAINRMEEE